MGAIPVLYTKQKRILEFIRDYCGERGHGPKLQEIADAMGLRALSTVHAHLERLEKKGVLRRSPDKGYIMDDSVTSGFRLQASGFSGGSGISKSISVPLAGNISAGLPIEAIEEGSETVEVDPSLMGRGETYALRVKGQSMQDHHICDGDVVLIEKQANARNGETVVALLDDNTVTLKDYYKEKTGFRLQPRNPAFPPIYVKQLTIQGRVIGLLRRYL